MKRTLDETMIAVQQAVESGAENGAARGVRVLVYPPEREAEMLVGLRWLAADRAGVDRGERTGTTRQLLFVVDEVGA